MTRFAWSTLLDDWVNTCTLLSTRDGEQSSGAYLPMDGKRLDMGRHHRFSQWRGRVQRHPSLVSIVDGGQDPHDPDYLYGESVSEARWRHLDSQAWSHRTMDAEQVPINSSSALHSSASSAADMGTPCLATSLWKMPRSTATRMAKV